GVQREHLSGEAGQVVLGGEPYAPEQGDDLLPSRVEQGGVELHGSLSQPGPFPALYLYPTTYTRSSKAPARGNDPRFAYAGCPAGLTSRRTPAGAPRGPGRSSSGSPPGRRAGPGSPCTCPW